MLVEPYAGGCITSPAAVFEDLVERAVLVEKDPHVAAVWHTVLSADAEWLAAKGLS
jgi:DNA adenine methylase